MEGDRGTDPPGGGSWIKHDQICLLKNDPFNFLKIGGGDQGVGVHATVTSLSLIFTCNFSLKNLNSQFDSFWLSNTIFCIPIQFNVGVKSAIHSKTRIFRSQISFQAFCRCINRLCVKYSTGVEILILECSEKIFDVYRHAQ